MEVAEADFLEETEALGDLWEDVAGDEFFALVVEAEVLEMGRGFVDGEMGEGGDGGGFAARRSFHGLPRDGAATQPYGGADGV